MVRTKKQRQEGDNYRTPGDHSRPYPYLCPPNDHEQCRRPGDYLEAPQIHITGSDSRMTNGERRRKATTIESNLPIELWCSVDRCIINT